MSILTIVVVSLFVALFLLLIMLVLFGGPSDGALRDYLREAADHLGFSIGPMGYLEGTYEGHPMVIIPNSGGQMVISCPMTAERTAFALVEKGLPHDTGLPEVSPEEAGLSILGLHYTLHADGRLDFLQGCAEHIRTSPVEMIIGKGHTLTAYCDSTILAYRLEELEDILTLVVEVSQSTA